MKYSIEKYLKDQIFEPITEVKKQEIIFKRQEFFDWLKIKRLDYLLDNTREKTSFEWKCLIDIMNILRQFDSLIEQHDRQFGKPIDTINENLRRKMTYFSEEYDEPDIIDECNQNVLPKDVCL